MSGKIAYFIVTVQPLPPRIIVWRHHIRRVTIRICLCAYSTEDIRRRWTKSVPNHNGCIRKGPLRHFGGDVLPDRVRIAL